MISKREFLVRTRLDQTTLEAWIAEEWLLPSPAADGAAFTDADVARAALICDLKETMDVNDAGIGVILSLVDQVHGLRWTLTQVLASVRERPSGPIAGPADRQDPQA
jgi:chaperone modulatory protein CbpM